MYCLTALEARSLWPRCQQEDWRKVLQHPGWLHCPTLAGEKRFSFWRDLSTEPWAWGQQTQRKVGWDAQKQGNQKILKASNAFRTKSPTKDQESRSLVNFSTAMLEARRPGSNQCLWNSERKLFQPKILFQLNDQTSVRVKWRQFKCAMSETLPSMPWHTCSTKTKG